MVIAVTGEAADSTTPYLKDRLYLGFHEKAETLEVISYNPAAGRFEFQVADDYRAGGTARLRYANRALCLACHQNAAPIFSRQSWDESSANPRIATSLGAAAPVSTPSRGAPGGHPQRHRRRHRPCQPAAAGRRAVARGLRHGRRRQGVSRAIAAPGAAPAAGRRVAPSLALPEIQDSLLKPLLAQWRSRWPEGIVVGNPDLPNRQPFAGLAPDAPTPAGAALERAADISAAFDPSRCPPSRPGRSRPTP